MIRLLTWGPRNGPQTPNARRASAKPRRASIIVAGVGPRNGPHTPNARRASAKPRRASIIVAGVGAPQWPLHLTGPRNGPQTPDARRAPGNPWRASMSRSAPRAPRKLMARFDVAPAFVVARRRGAALGVASSRRTARSIGRRGRPAG